MDAAAGPGPEAGAPPGTGDRRARRIALALLVATWLAFVFPVFAGKARFPVDMATGSAHVANPELGDAVFAMYPWHSYLGERLRAGHVPLWDPYRFAGTPFAADSAPAVFYPPNWLYASGRVLATLTVIAVASLLGALLLAHWFFRVLRLHPYAAALGAVVLVFSAAIIRYSGNEPVLASSMWLPLALGGLEVARRGRRRRGATLAGLGLGLSLLGGHAQIALLVWLAAALWAGCGLASTAWERRAGGWRVAGRAVAVEALPVAGAFALAVGFSAAQLLPTAELAGAIVRQRTTFAVAHLTALPVRHLPTLLVPDYQGSPLDRNYVGPGTNYTETALYAGLLTLPLAVAGLARLARRPGRAGAFFALLVAASALAVLGTPFYRLVLALPGFSHTLFMTRFILLLDVGLAGLAALGADAVLGGRDRRAAVAGVVAAAALAVAVAALAVARPWTDAPGAYVTARAVRSLVIAVAGAGLLALAVRWRRAQAVPVAMVALVAADLWAFGYRLNPFQTPRPLYTSTPAIDALAAAPGPRPRFANVGNWWVAPNGELSYGLYGISGYDPFVPRRVVELLSLADDQRARARSNFFGPFPASIAGSPLLDLLGVGSLASGGGTDVGLPVRAVGPFAVHERPNAFPPAWVASCWEVAAPSRVLPRLATMTATDLAGTAVVADEGVARRAVGALAGGGGGGGGGECGARAAVVADYEPEHVHLRTDGAGVVVLSDAWFPGWRARVDGRPAPLLRVDHALRGVAVAAGSHSVVLDYRPVSVAAGMAVSAATVVGMWAWAAVPFLPGGRRRRRDRAGR